MKLVELSHGVFWSSNLKIVLCNLLIWRLAAGLRSPGDSQYTNGSGVSGAWRRGIFRQANEAITVTFRSVGPGRWRRNRRAVATRIMCFEALSAWRYVTPARRSGSWQCLAVRVPRQAIYTVAALSFDYEFVIYSASSDALRVRLLVFLELWLGTYPLSCGSG
ncbi:hypothetical protein DEO72_LG2g3460 [Vigna unguiculata]|uniref:Uncharacterized protein n=1 Tax=Vigna unguiculata TaxID=3917 RepID=A0A4D6L3L7_VIGUN|nr:hypothetical protein DEO72_LG2g3460 [Vigna unguiculata]